MIIINLGRRDLIKRPSRYLHYQSVSLPKELQYMLKSTRVEIVKMLEIFSECI